MKISIQTGDVVDELGLAEGYRAIREAGFEAIDWNLDHAWKFSELQKAPSLQGLCIFERSMPEIRAHYAEELALIRQNGLAITQAHAPFPPHDARYPGIFAYAVSVYRQMILFCNEVDCPRLVIHGICLGCNDAPEITTSDIERLNLELYEALIPTLQKTSVTVCLENLFSGAGKLGQGYREGICADPHQAIALIDGLNEKAGKLCFGLCLDTGHLNLTRRDPRYYIPMLGKRIVCLHIHDNSQQSDMHLMPYVGNIDWAEYLRELRRAGYCGDLSFETFNQVRMNRTPRELIPHFLRLIAQIGGYFRSELQK